MSQKKIKLHVKKPWALPCFKVLTIDFTQGKPRASVIEGVRNNGNGRCSDNPPVDARCIARLGPS